MCLAGKLCIPRFPVFLKEPLFHVLTSAKSSVSYATCQNISCRSCSCSHIKGKCADCWRAERGEKHASKVQGDIFVSRFSPVWLFWHFEEASSPLVWGKTLSFNNFLHYTVYHVWMGFLKDALAKWEMCVTSNKVGVIRTNEALGFSLCVYLWFKGLLYDYLCGLGVLLHEASLTEIRTDSSLCAFFLSRASYFLFFPCFLRRSRKLSHAIHSRDGTQPKFATSQNPSSCFRQQTPNAKTGLQRNPN